MTGPEPSRRSGSHARFEAMYEEIRLRICTLRYPPNTLLREEVLSQEFEVSRTPIRRVLARLEDDGLVEIRHGVGTIVTMIDPQDLEDVYRLRMGLAEMLGTLSPLPATGATVETLRDCRSAFLALKKNRDIEAFARTNIAYYTTVCRQTGNRHLAELSLKLFLQTSRIWLLRLPSMDWDGTLDDIAREIEDLLRALEIGDHRGFGALARSHIFWAMTRHKEALGQTQA